MHDSINERISRLNAHFHPDDKFISGGVACETEYQKLKLKVMMLLKEVNDPNSHYDWSLPQLLEGIYNKKIPFYRTWANVCRWLLVAQYPDICFADINDERLYEALLWVATTNLKKTAGKGSSDMSEIASHAHANASEWFEEISIIRPDIVVCAGTYSIAKEVLGSRIHSMGVCKSGAEYLILNDRILIDFPHPTYRTSDKSMFAYFKETIRAIRSIIDKDDASI